MAKLTGQTIAASYDQVLIVDHADGISASLQAIESADTGGSASSLKISTSKCEVIPASNATSIFEVSQADGTAVLSVDTTNARVGIGMNDPDTMLHLEHSSGSTIRLSKTAGSGDDAIIFAISGGVQDGDTDMGGINMRQDGAADSSRLEFITEKTGAADSIKMTIKGTGLIGIGTGSPGAQLDIHNATTHAADQGGTLRLAANDGTVMVNTDRLGAIEFAGAEDTSSTMAVGARIQAVAMETWDGSNNGANLDFYTTPGNNDPTKRMSIQSGGDVHISTGNIVIDNSGYGINFGAATPDAGGMTSEILDDYEEGSWTPVWTFASGSLGYSAQIGRYTKVGRLVTCTFDLIVNDAGSLGTPGNAVLAGLPFTTQNVQARGAINISFHDGFGVVPVGGYINQNAATINVSTSAAGVALAHGAFGGNERMMGSFFYYVA